MLHKTDVDQKEVVFMWVPRHVGILGNDVVDRAAKKALDNKECTNILALFSNLKSLTAKHVH